MKISKEGINFIKKEEGFIPKAYWDYKQCSAGFGSGTHLNGEPVKKGDIVTYSEAEKMLLHWIEKIIIPFLKNEIKINLNQNQIDSVISLVYNVGNRAFEKSKALKFLNQRDFENFCKEAFSKEYGFVNADNKKNNTLIARRKREEKVFRRGYVK